MNRSSRGTPRGNKISDDCFERDFDYYGNDINAESGHKNYARGAGKCESAQECQRLCQETEECLVFTYKTGNKECWLKSTDSGRSYRVGDISGKNFCDREGMKIYLGTLLFLYEDN